MTSYQPNSPSATATPIDIPALVPDQPDDSLNEADDNSAQLDGLPATNTSGDAAIFDPDEAEDVPSEELSAAENGVQNIELYQRSGFLDSTESVLYMIRIRSEFRNRPDTLNRFLDTMTDYWNGAIDTPSLLEHMAPLFAADPELYEGFNIFLPPGHRIECERGDCDSLIFVTTPMGTRVQGIIHHSAPLQREDSQPSTSAASDRAVNDAVNGAVNGD